MLRSPFHFTFISGFSMKLIRMAMREGLTPLIINDSMPSVWSNLSNACEQCLYAQPFHYYFLPHHIHCNLSMQLPGRGGHRTYFVGVGTPHNIYKKRLGYGGPSQRITPLCGSILQAGTCQILSLAENPRWSRVWQITQVTMKQ